ncbi:MAG: GtrA family protein [Amphiplicatus sp.]|uniref:GtrA family protein n=1 Tax=Methylocystis sp. TaxID=1911079 RepID=UPI003D0C76DE
MTKQFAAFVIAGGIAAAVNWLSRIGLSALMSLELAVIVAYLIGMTTAYGLTRLFVFESSGRHMREEYVRFALVNVVALAQVFAVTIGLSRFVFPSIGFDWRPHEVAHAIGVASPILTSYVGHRHFTFAKKGHG